MTTLPFESCNFHDNYIHGISFSDENFECDLLFDIDYIIQWYCENDTYEFLVSPAILKFSKVEKINISIVKEGFTLNSYLAIIEDITSSQSEGKTKKYEFKLIGQDKISFFADGAELQIKGNSIRSSTQYLTVEQRSRA